MRKLDFVSLQVRDLEVSKDFYTNKLGFEIDKSNSQAYIFKSNEGEAVFAIRVPLENIEGKELGVGVSHWFAVSENIDVLKERFVENGVTTVGPILDTPFGKAFQVIDLDGYKLTFLTAK